MTERRFTNAQIDRLLRPKSVAVIGASDRKGALGATLLNNLVQYEFAGDIYPVNPKRDELLGLKVYHSVDELPEGIDCAVLAIPRPFVLDTVRQLAARKEATKQFLDEKTFKPGLGAFDKSKIKSD